MDKDVLYPFCAQDSRNLELVKRTMLDDVELAMRMWSDPFVQMYQDVDPPKADDPILRKFGAIMLLGPTSRNQVITLNWRMRAVKYLRDALFRGWIFVPENRGGYGRDWNRGLKVEFDAPKWETDRWLKDAPELKEAKVSTLSWIPRDEHEMIGLNTNWEEGHQTGMVDSGSPHEGIFIGWPEKPYRVKLPLHYLERMKRKGWNMENNFSHNLQILCERNAKYMGAPPRSSLAELDDDIPF